MENEFWEQAERAMDALKIDDKDEPNVPFEKVKEKSYNKDYYDRTKEKRRQDWRDKKNDPTYSYDKEYHRNYYQKNKQKMIDYQKRKVLCECGDSISYANLTHHKRYNNHLLKLYKKLLENKDDRCADTIVEIP